MSTELSSRHLRCRWPDDRSWWADIAFGHETEAWFQPSWRLHDRRLPFLELVLVRRLEGAFGRSQGVLNQHGDCHRSDPARHRRYPRSLFFHLIETHIADDTAIWQTVDPDVDDDGALFHHLRHDQTGLARGHDQDVGQDGVLREVARLGVAYCHRRLALQQHAIGCAGRENAVASDQCADVVEVKTVHVLVHRDRLQHAGNLDVRWQRQLHQDRSEEHTSELQS